MEGIPAGTPLLLHACCAPCSSATLEKLAGHFAVTLFFYNPNITIEAEYHKRLEELRRFVAQFDTAYPVTVLEGRYDPQEFFEIAKGLENEPERGARCYKCYRQRLDETAKVAARQGFEYFTTTLSLSPHKNADWINRLGKEAEGQYNATFLYCDFKKKNGYKRSIELSKQYDLYRQDYCGCIYSKAKRERFKQEHNQL